MNINELSRKEIELDKKISILEGSIDDKRTQIKLLGIPEEYFAIHKEYSDLANNDIEALKRGLFLQWFYIVEPPFLTGIFELDEIAQDKIIKILNDLILSNSIDYELKQMLKHYKEWNYVYERFAHYKSFYNLIFNSEKNDFEKFYKFETENRGLMGIYWSSLF